MKSASPILREFIDRRLLPAIQTCAWAGRRQQALSERISRVSNLLRTRVEIEQQQANKELLNAMNRRQQAQLLLQSAVEGLSIAAVTYYGCGLVGYLAKGAGGGVRDRTRESGRDQHSADCLARVVGAAPSTSARASGGGLRASADIRIHSPCGSDKFGPCGIRDLLMCLNAPSTVAAASPQTLPRPRCDRWIRSRL